MKRWICSCDMAEVPGDCYVLREEAGEMYFCNSRCLFLWAGTFVTKSNLPEDRLKVAFELTEPDGKVCSFVDFLHLAQWAAANALSGRKTVWYQIGDS